LHDELHGIRAVVGIRVQRHGHVEHQEFVRQIVGDEEEEREEEEHDAGGEEVLVDEQADVGDVERVGDAEDLVEKVAEQRRFHVVEFVDQDVENVDLPRQVPEIDGEPRKDGVLDRQRHLDAVLVVRVHQREFRAE